MVTTIKNVSITGTGSYAPEQIFSNEYICTLVDSTPDWIYNTLGIRERHIAKENECTSDLAEKAARQAMSMAGLTADDIDLIIVATTTPDRIAPSTACIVQEKIGAYNAAAFDMNAVCSGFLYGSTVAAQFVSSGMYDNVLIIGADTFSKIIDWTRRDCVFFGDGAGAAVFSRSVDGTGFLNANLHADGRGKMAWTIPAGGSESPTSQATVDAGEHTFIMNGKDVFDTATTVLPEAINQVLRSCDLPIEDIKYVIPHQPSIGILKKTAETLETDFSKFLTNMDRYANTSAGTIPILLDETNRAGMLKSGDLILFAAIGAGWTWGASVMKWT